MDTDHMAPTEQDNASLLEENESLRAELEEAQRRNATLVEEMPTQNPTER
jgi:hypothetical protein